MGTTILVEPSQRGTAPAAMLSALQANHQFGDVLLLIMPADHVIDYAVIERVDNLMLVPTDMGWNDVGSWDSLGSEQKTCPENQRSD